MFPARPECSQHQHPQIAGEPSKLSPGFLPRTMYTNRAWERCARSQTNESIHSEIKDRLSSVMTPDLLSTIGLQRADRTPGRCQKQPGGGQHHTGSLQLPLAPAVG